MKKILLGIILSGACFVIFIATLSHYGINWDESNHYIRGQAYLRYFLTGKENYSDLPKLKSHFPRIAGRALPSGIAYEDDKSFRRSIYQYEAKKTQSYSWYLKNDFGHPPLNGILASLSNLIFYQRLGWLGDIQSYHLFIIAAVSFAIFSIFIFTSTYYGVFSGVIAVLALFLYPLLFSESHFNIKDPVEMSFYTLTILTFYLGVVRNSLKFIILTGIFAGLALGTKLNIAFLVLTIFPWILILKWNDVKNLRWPFNKSVTFGILAIPLIALGILFASWPFLWNNSWSHFLSFLSYYKTIGGVSYQWNTPFYIFGLNTYAVQWVIFTTPIITLALTFFGTIFVLTHGAKEKNKTSLLILLWLMTPIARVMLPNSGIYGGVRQIMEYIPAIAMLSGIGAGYIVKLLNGYIVSYLKQYSNLAIKPLFLLQFITILSFIPITLKLISIHPNENVYFNPLIGGLKGASQHNFQDWGTTLGSAYKGGIDWINTNTPENSKLALARGLLSNIPRIFVRKDIYFSESHYSGNKKAGEYLMEVVDYRWDIDTPKEKRQYIDTLVPVYEEKVDGVAILKIWKNDVEHAKN